MVPISLAEWFIWTVPLLIGIGWLRDSENTCKMMLVATASGLLGLFLHLPCARQLLSASRCKEVRESQASGWPC